MQIVIDIPEEYYEVIRKSDLIVSGQRSGKTFMADIYGAIAKGKPLPKHHGNLIDFDALDKDYTEKEGKVQDNLAEGFMQCEKLVKRRIKEIEKESD